MMLSKKSWAIVPLTPEASAIEDRINGYRRVELVDDAIFQERERERAEDSQRRIDAAKKGWAKRREQACH